MTYFDLKKDIIKEVIVPKMNKFNLSDDLRVSIEDIINGKK